MSNGGALTEFENETTPIVTTTTVRLSATVYEVGGTAPTNIIHADQDWYVEVEWSIAGNLIHHLCGEWRVSVNLESIGPGPEYQIPDPSDTVSMDPCGDGTYKHTIRIPAGTVDARDPDGTLYLIGVTLASRDYCGGPGHIYAYCTGEEIQFVQGPLYEKTYKSQPEEIRAPMKDVDVGAKFSKDGINTTTIVFDQEGFADQNLTPAFFANAILPYLTAITEIQLIIDEIEDEPYEVRIRSITQDSPVTATVEGVAKATQILAELVIPWRRRHAQTLAGLAEQEKLAIIEKTKAEVLETRARAAHERGELAKQYAEVEKMQLENEKMRLELANAKIDLALKILEKISPDLSEKQRIAYVTRLLLPLETIISSPLEATFPKQNEERATTK